MEIVTDIPDVVMQLPADYEVVVKDTGASLTAPRLELLREQQRIAFDMLLAYVKNELPEELQKTVRAMLLEGYAGTGKTFTIGEFIKYLIMMLHKRIAITAPTNKAVKVLKRTTGMKHTLLTFKTIHALLGLKEDYDDDGKQIFVADFGEPRAIEEVDILIVDESSMLPDELFHEIDICINKQGLKVIFMGDPIQIPPVNKPDCIPFIEGHRQTYGIHRLTLTDVIRQKDGNPILELATLLRNNVTASQVPFEYRTQMTSQGGVIMIERTDKNVLYKLCEHYFGNKRFNLDPDFVKVIAWTNKTVDFMNNKIRMMIYKDAVHTDTYGNKSLKKIMVGEKLIADKPITKKEVTAWGEKDKIIFTTNDEFEVMSYEFQEVNAFGNFRVPVYRTKVRITDEDGKERREVIDIVHETGIGVYQQVLATLRKYALDEKDKFERKRKWKNYYSIQNKFAEVKYNYAITAHKSQGSTYDNAIVIEPDIEYNAKLIERNRIKYVSYTRARNLLFIVK